MKNVESLLDKIKKYWNEDLELENYEDISRSDLVLEEARRLFDWEEDRRKTIENKPRILIGINALIISITAGFSLSGTLINFVLLSSLLSAVIGVLPLLNWKYQRPVDYEDIYPLSEKSSYDSERMVLRNYRESIRWNKWINGIKYDLFKFSLGSTISSMVLLSLKVLL